MTRIVSLPRYGSDGTLSYQTASSWNSSMISSGSLRSHARTNASTTSRLSLAIADCPPLSTDPDSALAGAVADAAVGGVDERLRPPRGEGHVEVVHHIAESHRDCRRYEAATSSHPHMVECLLAEDRLRRPGI